MPSIITRVYESREQALAAVALLKSNSFGGIQLIEPGTADPASVLRRAGVAANAISSVATEVTEGSTAVAVEAPFGGSYQVMNLLDRFNPKAIRITPTHVGADLSSIFSETLMVPVLLANPRPISEMIGLPLLVRGPKSTKLMDNPAPLSRTLGLPLLSTRQPSVKLVNSATPFSSLLGLPVLSKATPGRKLLKTATPLSSLLGLPVLIRGSGKAKMINNPAPLSKLLGLPVLSSRKPSVTILRAPETFSANVLGLRTLTKSQKPIFRYYD
jgi:hypothetical protein